MSSSPITFQVGVLKERAGSFGKLTITAGRATLESWPIRRQLVVHDHRRVVFVRPRIDLFARRSVFVLQGDAGAYGVRAGLYSVKRLEQAFVAAGFELEEQPTLFTALPAPPFWATRTPRRRRGRPRPS